MQPFRFTVIADTHHYSKTLGTTGKAYELRSGSDQKCLAETGKLLDAAFAKIAASDTQAVLIAGDLTNDGERICHEEFREKLYRLREKKPVYVITATHDWCCDENPRRYSGDQVSHDVPVMSSHELRDFYRDFGPDAAEAEFVTHLGTSSYVVRLSENIKLLALNDDQNGKGRAGFKEDHFRWIEEQIKKAREENCVMIGMEHHLLIAHVNPLLTGGGTCVGDREEVAARLADAGLKYMFVGHSHIQHTDHFVSPAGNKITEVNVGSLVGYPAPIVNVTVNPDGTLRYEVDHLEEFTWNGQTVPALPYLREHALALVHRVLESSDKNDFAEKLTALQLNGEKMKKFYPIIRPVLRYLRKVTVWKLYKRIRFKAKNIDRALIERHRDEKVMDYVDDMFLAFFDGTLTPHAPDSDYYLLVMSFVGALRGIAPENDTINKLYATCETLLTGGEYNNQQSAI